MPAPASAHSAELTPPFPLVPALEDVRSALHAWPARLGAIVALALLYFALGRAGLLLAVEGGPATAVWPPSGIALAALLIFGWRLWPGIWLGSFAVNAWGLLVAQRPLPLDTALGTAAAIATGATVTALLGAWLVQWAAGPGQPLDRIRGVLALVGLGGMLSSVVSATNGAFWLELAGHTPAQLFARIWTTWWVGDSAGVFLFAPLLLAWCAPAVKARAQSSLEAIACLVLLAWSSACVFIGESAITFPAKSFSYILIPLLVWPAVRLGPRGVTFAVLLIGAVATLGTVNRLGPFFHSTPSDSLVALVSFLSVMTLTSLCATALVAQQRRAEAERQRTLDELEARVRERTADHAQAEAQVRASEERLRASIENTPNVAVQWYDERGRVLFWNRASERMFGFSSEEALGKTLDELIQTPEEAAAFVAVLADLRTTGRALGPVEYPFRRRDGSHGVCVSTTFPIPSFRGEPCFVCMDVDVTERKRAEDELRESEGRFRDLFEHSPDAIFVESVDGVVLDVNPAGCRLHGLTREELLGRSVQELVPPEERAVVAREFPAVAAGECGQFHGFSLRSDGRAVPVEVTSRRIVFSNEPAVLLHVRDVSERRQLEEQFRQSQKMEAIGQLAGGLAHDFNNLLTVILGNVALVESGSVRAGQERALIEEIGLAAERAANLTRQMLAFSRRQVMQARPLDLNTIVNDIANMLRRILGEHVMLQLESSAGLPAVQADPGMMEQVLLNLGINARDAMPGGGRLIIRTAVETVSEDEARLHADATPGRFVCISMSDTGRGIAPEHLPHIFEPFFTTKEVGKGTGLGLAMVYGIVRQHRGWLRVASSPRGTTFEIFLPALLAIAEPAETPSPLPAVPGGSETILLVEDESSVRQIGRAVLERLGYRVIEAPSGVAALEAWPEVGVSVDLVLTDLIMPGGLSGRELAERLWEQRPALKVIYCSAYGAEVMGPDFALEEGVNFLQKPYEFHHLALTVRACLDGAKPSRN